MIKRPGTMSQYSGLNQKHVNKCHNVILVLHKIQSSRVQNIRFSLHNKINSLYKQGHFMAKNRNIHVTSSTRIYKTFHPCFFLHIFANVMENELLAKFDGLFDHLSQSHENTKL